MACLDYLVLDGYVLADEDIDVLLGGEGLVVRCSNLGHGNQIS